MIQAILFDCFGVLVGRGFNETYRLAGGNPVKDRDFIEDALYRANMGMISNQEFDGLMTEHLSISHDRYRQAIDEAEQPNKELLEYIAGLHENYKTAILSNANVGVLERKLDPAVLQRDFDTLVISAEVGVVKPDPRMYEIAAERLGVDVGACVFIDDQQRYCDGAEAVGMRSLRYQSLRQMKDDLEKILAK